MKKMNNKGFSLVELIIVIAIMAILAGAIAPALIRYIDKSRKSNDVSSCKTIKTAVETALGNESIYEYLTNITDGNDFMVITVNPGKATESSGGSTGAITFSGLGTTPEGLPSDIDDVAKKEIGTNIGEKTPKVKFKKAIDDADFTDKPTKFYACVTEKGTVYVLIGNDTAPTTITVDGDTISCTQAHIICPEICEAYQ